jgi:hypothetical protein
MRYILLGAAITGLTGCAYVPDLEPENTFSYAEIANQIECETYYSAALLLINDDDPSKSSSFDDWSMDLTVTPNHSDEASINFAGANKTTLSKTYLNWTLGGGASPGSMAYDMYGDANAKNEYQFAVRKLLSDTKDDDIVATRGDGKTITVHNIAPPLANSCRPSSQVSVREAVQGLIGSAYTASDPSVHATLPTLVAPGQVANIFDGRGVFGIYEFLKRSFAVNTLISIPPKSLSFTKEYKVKVQAGVTRGWYNVYGNFSPNTGGIYMIDNTVTLAFAPPSAPPPPSKPIEVTIVGQIPAPPPIKKSEVHPPEVRSAISAPHKVRGAISAAHSSGVSDRQSDILTNAVISNGQTQILNKLNQVAP